MIPVNRNAESLPAGKPTVADDILAGLTEFVDALKSGDDLKGRFNCHQVRLDLKPDEYTPDEVKAARKLFGMSQKLFAQFLGVSVQAVRHWEQGLKPPSPMARRFMDEMRRDPDHFRQRLQEVAIPK